MFGVLLVTYPSRRHEVIAGNLPSEQAGNDFISDLSHAEAMAYLGNESSTAFFVLPMDDPRIVDNL